MKKPLLYPPAQTIPSHKLFLQRLAQEKSYLQIAEAKEVALKKRLDQEKKPLYPQYFPIESIQLTYSERQKLQEANLKITYQQLIHRLQAELDVNQQVLAQQLGITLQKLYQIEAGKVLPTMADLIQIASFCGKSVQVNLI